MIQSAKRWRLFAYTIIGLIVGFILAQSIASYGEAQARRTTKDRMKQLSIALHSYHDTYNSFPPAFVQGPDGRMWHSWRTLLLPHLGENDLAVQYRLDEPWDGPHNRELAAKCPEVFQSPHWGTEPGRTNFYGVIGRRTAWPAHHSVSVMQATDGTSNTIHLVEGPPVATWTEPRDLRISDWDNAFRAPGRTGSHASLMDGSVRYLAANIDRSTQMSLLTPSFGKQTYSGPDWPDEWNESAEPGESVAAIEIRDVRAMTGTDVLAAASAPFDPAKNQIWCATSQIAWDEMRRHVGGDVVTSPKLAMVDQLNRETFDRQALSPETYVAVITGGSFAETQDLRARLQELFPGVNVPLQPMPVDGLPRLRFLACLFKSMPFEEKLERIKTPLGFKHGGKTTNSVSFGRVPIDSKVLGEPVLTGQLEVGDYISDDDFIMILHTNTRQYDQVILAHTVPGKTLRETWNDVNARLKTPHSHRVLSSVHSGERLQIPILEFGLSKSFDELVRLSVSGFPVESFIESATETIQFRLDERGAEILAVAEYSVVGEFGDEPAPRFDPTKPRSFVFDQPFFIALREKDASEPYFLAWIANPELMVPAESTP
jgi:hypothetical protein